jgi:hypothetical protein
MADRTHEVMVLLVLQQLAVTPYDKAAPLCKATAAAFHSIALGVDRPAYFRR